MRLLDKDGFPLADHHYDGIDRNDRAAMEAMKKDYDDNYDDAPFSIVGDDEIPNWVRDGEALEALGFEE